MGIIWKFAMPLLSTLAALVIIVHTAEEDMESEYQRGLKTRVLDPGTPQFDQPWRSIEAEEMVHPTQSPNWDDDSPEKHAKRRRLGRKRKRKLQPLPADDLVPQERYTYPEEPSRPFFEVGYGRNRQTTDLPRRRKNPMTIPNRWTDESLKADRPLRRRGLRRKRPSLDMWPELSEFKYQRDHKDPEIGTMGQEEFSKDTEEEISMTTTDSPQLEVYNPIDDDEFQLTRNRVKEDKSLSEFSFELMNPPEEVDDYKIKLPEQSMEKFTGIKNNIEKAQDSGPIDPVTLREILKQSNGTSLSEILQQHNLSLSDLLHGRGNALKVLKSKNTLKISPQPPLETKHDFEVNTDEKLLIHSNTKYVTELIAENYSVTTEDYPESEKQTTSHINVDVKLLTVDDTPLSQTLNRSLPRIATKRRIPAVIRRKQRIRPLKNNTLQAEISTDLIAPNARKYLYHNRRNSTKYRERNDTISTTKSNNNTEDFIREDKNDTVTVVSIPEITTTLPEFDNRNNNDASELEIDSNTTIQSKIRDTEIINIDVTEDSIVTTKIIDNDIKMTEKFADISTIRPVNASTLRRQAFNNRLKKKRIKQKNSTTEPPQDDLLRSLYGMGNLVSSSEFIARTQTPKSVPVDQIESEMTLEDFILTTETPKKLNKSRTTRPLVRFSTTSELPEIVITTEETAKIEIEEILNDTLTSHKLSQILMERNMTLSELVQHRERGSSHVHLADIFHNASKEPNPPEPFLSKSLIEPISREIYPLRALLDANSHDPTGKAKAIDLNFEKSNLANIPVVMNFGSNVNENAENMGIMSLFNNFTKSEVKQDSDGTSYKISISNSTVTQTRDMGDTMRDGNVLEESKDDVVSWNEIFSLMRRNQGNATEKLAQISNENLSPTRTSKKIITLEDELDGEGLIVLEDLQHLKDFDNNIASVSNDKLEVNSTYEKTNVLSPAQIPGFLDKIPSNTKSVTVATASIAGLAMVLFLLTYAAFKWKQQQTLNRKKHSFCDERISTPVFESRKGHKNNSSTRSISPMLSSSNIYTLNKLDSRNGKESPDYMWDTLRKPFQ